MNLLLTYEFRFVFKLGILISLIFCPKIEKNKICEKLPHISLCTLDYLGDKLSSIYTCARFHKQRKLFFRKPQTISHIFSHNSIESHAQINNLERWRKPLWSIQGCFLRSRRFRNIWWYFWLSWGLGAIIGIQWMRGGDAQYPEKYMAVSHKEVLSKMSTERK